MNQHAAVAYQGTSSDPFGPKHQHIQGIVTKPVQVHNRAWTFDHPAPSQGSGRDICGELEENLPSGVKKQG